MAQLSRLISILTLLRSKRMLTATELAEKFDVSVRTIYRDMRRLEEAGVPVVTIEGKGYSLMEGYVVDPVQFTEKEANALITAQHLLKNAPDRSLVRHFEDALTKIKSVFRLSVQEKSEMLSSKLYVFGSSWYDDISSDILVELQSAITNLNLADIHYQKLGEEVIGERRIEPCALYCSFNKWILIAWCHLRKDYRAFRIDRIRSYRILPEHFQDRKFNIQTYFLSCPYEEK